MNPYHHALSSVKKHGGKPTDYLAIHQWFDESKSYFADFRHRALRHHSEGIFLMESIFGVTVLNSDGKMIPTRFIGEQHVKEDCGFIPTVQDWLKEIRPVKWMLKPGVKNVEEAMTRIETDAYTNSGMFKEGVDPEVTCWHCKKTFLCDCMDATCRMCGAPYDARRCGEFNFIPDDQKSKIPIDKIRFD